MKKSDLIKEIAKHAEGLTQKQAEQGLNALLDVIGESLKAGNAVTLVGFGSFEVKERAARTGRNPATGAEINIPAAKVPSFKAGKVLKDAVQSAS
jgi:nucleoid DNA-binding protein